MPVLMLLAPFIFLGLGIAIGWQLHKLFGRNHSC